MESQLQNPESRKNPENFHPWPCPTTMAFAIGQNRISHLMSLYIYMYIHNIQNNYHLCYSSMMEISLIGVL